MMNLNGLEQKLFAAARQNPPSEHVPYAFEKRIMSLLREHPAPNAVELWARALWRSAAACLTIALLLTGWNFVSHPAHTSTDLSQDFEQTMLAAVEQDNDYTW